jgi:hypothetical protein
LEIYETHIHDVNNFVLLMKEIRKILNEPIPKKLVLERSIIPSAKDISTEDSDMKDKSNFIRDYLTYILVVLNNESYIDLVSEKVPLAIVKL